MAVHCFDISSVKFHVIDPKCLVRIASSFLHHQRSDIDFSENMQFKLHFFFPMEKVYSYKKISVDVVTPAGRLLVSNGLWRLEVCEKLKVLPTDIP